MNPPSGHDSSLSAKRLPILIVILVAALLLRVHHLGRNSLWLDETFSLGMTVGNDVVQLQLPETNVYSTPPNLFDLEHAQPWWRIWTHMHYDNHPPLHIIALRGWIALFGTSESALRSLSVVFSMLAILLFFDAVRNLHGTVASLWAAAMMAVAIPQIQYAQEARSYVMLVCEGTLALAAVARIERFGPSLLRSAALGFAILTMALTHYFAAGAIVALFIFCVAHFDGKSRRQIIVAFLIAGAVGGALWGREMWIQHKTFSEGTVSWLAETKSHPAMVAIARVMLINARFFFDSKGILQAASAALALLFVLPWLGRRKGPMVILWWSWLVGILIPIFALDILHHTATLSLIRYTLFASPAVYALLATSSEWLSKKFACCIPIALIIISLFMIPRQAYHLSWKPDWRAAAKLIDDHRKPNEPLLVTGVTTAISWPPDCLYAPLSYYLKPSSAPVIWLQDPGVDPEILRPFKSSDGLWAITSIDPMDATWCPPGWVIESSQQFQGIGVVEHLIPK